MGKHFSVIYFLVAEIKYCFEDSQALPACPSLNGSIKMKNEDMYKCPSAPLFTTNPTRTDLWWNVGLLGERQAMSWAF